MGRAVIVIESLLAAPEPRGVSITGGLSVEPTGVALQNVRRWSCRRRYGALTLRPLAFGLGREETSLDGEQVSGYHVWW